MSKVDEQLQIERNALAMALYNLIVRNNINPQDFIKTMKDTRKKIRNQYGKA